MPTDANRHRMPDQRRGRPLGLIVRCQHAIVTASRISGSSLTGGIQSTATLNITDIYALDNDLPARWSPNASWVGHKTILISTRRLGEGTTTNSITFWQNLGGGLPSNLIGYPVYMSSSMDSTVVSGSTDDVLVLGDFSQFVISDRIGMSIAFEPRVKGASFRPTGSVGWFCHWRVGSDIVAPRTHSEC